MLIINYTYCHDITEILLKVALNTINPTPSIILLEIETKYSLFTLWTFESRTDVSYTCSNMKYLFYDIFAVALKGTEYM